MTLAEAKVEQQIVGPQAQHSSEVRSAAPLASAQDIIKPLDEETREFDFWEDLKESLPPWINEVVGLALIVFGVLSFISLYIANDALVAVTWADMLTALFGNGAILLAGALFALGVVLWLPKAGIHFRVSSTRMLALEIAFLSVLAILHLASSDSELRALARAGQGGGLIGWGISYPFFWLLGRPTAMSVLSVFVGLCLVVFVGLRPRHIAGILTRFSGRLRLFSEARRQPPETQADDESHTIYQRLAGSPSYRAQIMRIRPNPENLPQELRALRQSTSGQESAVSRIRPAQSTATEQADKSKLDKEARATAPSSSSDSEAPSDKADKASPPPADQLARIETPGVVQPFARVDWHDSLPSIDLLTPVDLVMPDEAEINRNAMLIQNTLLEFDLETTVIDVQVGPTVTRYALQPHKEDGSERIRMSRIASYSRDLSLALAAKRLRMETPVPGTNYMGIEVPNREAATVALRNVMNSEAYQREKANTRLPLLIPLGRNVTGEPVAVDLAQMPHLLIAGATGSGKSVCMAAIATALLMQCTPVELQLVMLDPKMVELSRFDGIPHLVGPVEIHPDRIIGVLRWCTEEMDRRYKLLEGAGARSITMYNEAELARGEDARTLPYMVILIDEIGDPDAEQPR